MKIKTNDKIEEMLISTEKKIHAGEWVRIEVVRILLHELAVWMNEMYDVESIKMKQELLRGLTRPTNQEEEE